MAGHDVAVPVTALHHMTLTALKTMMTVHNLNPPSFSECSSPEIVFPFPTTHLSLIFNDSCFLLMLPPLALANRSWYLFCWFRLSNGSALRE